MFYSHDLLGRKTPLGAIWTLAHGRKLSKGKIISINLREICDEILQPGVPHSLRLQGILIGGLVIVFNKQQTYLLEDLQEMMRRVKAASDVAVGGDATKAEKGKAGRTKGKRQDANNNNQARLEAITLMDMEDLMAPAAFGDDHEDILGLLAGGGSLSDVLANQGALQGDHRGLRLQGGELAGDLFEMPSLGATSSEAGDETDAEGRPDSRQQQHASSRGTRTATGSGRQQQQQEDEVYGGVDMMQHDWVNHADEMFADADADLDLLGGMDLPQAPAAAAHSDRSRDQTSSQQHRPEPTTSDSAAAAAAAGADGAAAGGGGGGVPYEFDDQLTMMDEFEQQQQQQQEEAPINEQQQEGDEEQQQQQQPSEAMIDHQQERDQAEQPAGQPVRKAKQRKRKTGNVVVDELDNLVIRSKVYREWSTDSSPLLRAPVKPGQLQHDLKAHTTAATPLLSGGPLLQNTIGGFGFGLGPFAGLGGGVVVPLAPELEALYRWPERRAAAERNAAGGGGAAKGQRPQQQPSSPEVNNSTGEGSLPGLLPHGSAHRAPLDLHQVQHHTGPEEDMMMMQDADQHLMEDFPPHLHDDDEQQQQQQEMMSNDEAHDQLGDLPFNGDIEIERLRAANTPGSSDGSLQHLLPGGGSAAVAQGRMMMGGRGRDSNATSAGGSSLLGGRSMMGDGSELGTGTKRRFGSADLDAADDLDIFFGTGNLADMLPDIEAAHYHDDMQQQQLGEEGPASEDLGNAAGVPRASGSVPGGSSDRELTPYNSSQFPLLEETEPDQATQLPQEQAAMSRTTRVALSIFQERLQRSREQQQAAAEVEDANDAAGVAAEPSVSFFGLIKEGRLSRNQAATLFYQVCVTTTAGFVSAGQERPYGDIIIKQGSAMG